MSDDVKGAVTTFVGGLPAFPALLAVLGFVLAVFGLTGGVEYNKWLPLAQLPARIGAIVCGVVLCAYGIYRANASPRQVVPRAKDYQVTIAYPAPNDHVTTVNVRGMISREPPPGYGLHVFRVYPSENFVPLRQAAIDWSAHTWEAASCDIGGKEGDQRQFAAYLVGPGGDALLDYYAEASRVHKPMKEQLAKLTGTDTPWLPLIRKRTPDMIECARVKVQRGAS